MARVMGIDAGLTAMGVVIVEGRTVVHAATCRTEKNAGGRKGVRVADDDAERAQQLARFLLDAIDAHGPTGAVVELPSGGAQGARANRAMGMSSGIVAAVLEARRLPVEWVTPQAVKKAATGTKDGSKDAVQASVKRQFDWVCALPRAKGQTEHIFDAAGAVLAASQGTLMRMIDQMSREAVSMG